MLTMMRMRVSKEDLESLADDERRFFLMACHAHNQLALHQRLVLFAMNAVNEKPVGDMEQAIVGAQVFALQRLLIGLIHETMTWLHRKDMADLLKRYCEKSPQLMEKRKKLRRLLKKDDFSSLRNDFIYHFPDNDDIDKAFRGIPSSEQWWLYMSEDRRNSYYQPGDLIISYGSLGPDDMLSAYKRISDTILIAKNELPDFLDEVMKAISDEKLKQLLGQMQAVPETVYAPDPTSFALPAFVDAPPREP